MARMKRTTYDVWTRDETGEETPHRVEIEWADQLRGELEAHKYGITTDSPLNTTNVWVWCAMTRLKLTTARYPEWKAGELVGLEKIKDPETGEPLEDVDVPPTGERSGLASVSLVPSPEPPSNGGLTPTPG